MSKRFQYKIVFDKWGTGGAEFRLEPSKVKAVVVHNSGTMVSKIKNYDPKKLAISYAVYHRVRKKRKGIQYHFFIDPYSDYIYIVNWLTAGLWHSSNLVLNKKSIAVLLDGNLHLEKPTIKQLLKLQQLLDDIKNKWFSKNGWVKFDQNIDLVSFNPVRISKTYKGVTYTTPLTWHRQVHQKAYTDCPGDNLIPHLENYIRTGNLLVNDKEKEMIAELRKQVSTLIIEKKNLLTRNEFLRNELGRLTEELSKCQRERNQYETWYKNALEELEKERETNKALNKELERLRAKIEKTPYPALLKFVNWLIGYIRKRGTKITRR